MKTHLTQHAAVVETREVSPATVTYDVTGLTETELAYIVACLAVQNSRSAEMVGGLRFYLTLSGKFTGTGLAQTKRMATLLRESMHLRYGTR